ncbi:hypothetical protein ACQJBY_064711 [Aegilops geniculata]
MGHLAHLAKRPSHAHSSPSPRYRRRRGGRGSHPRRHGRGGSHPPDTPAYIAPAPSPETLVHPPFFPPSTPSSSARNRGQNLRGHRCPALVAAATVVAVTRGHILEDRRARVLPSRGPARAGELRDRRHRHLLQPAVTNSPSMLSLRSTPGLPDLFPGTATPRPLLAPL